MGDRGFRELKVWQRAKDLAVHIYEITNSGVFNKDFGLRDQIRRSAVSIASNIAEGDERDTNKEAVRFLYIAKGSLAEVITQAMIAREIGYLPEAEYDYVVGQSDEIGKMLGKLIKVRRDKEQVIGNRL